MEYLFLCSLDHDVPELTPNTVVCFGFEYLHFDQLLPLIVAITGLHK